MKNLSECPVIFLGRGMGKRKYPVNAQSTADAGKYYVPITLLLWWCLIVRTRRVSGCRCIAKTFYKIQSPWIQPTFRRYAKFYLTVSLLVIVACWSAFTGLISNQQVSYRLNSNAFHSTKLIGIFHGLYASFEAVIVLGEGEGKSQHLSIMKTHVVELASTGSMQ